MNFLEEGVLLIGAIDFSVSFACGVDESGVFHSVKFYADAVGGIAKFGLEATQVGRGVAVEEKLHQQFNPGFGRDEHVNHASAVLSIKTTLIYSIIM